MDGASKWRTAGALFALSAATACIAGVMYILEEDRKRSIRIALKMDVHDRLRDISTFCKAKRKILMQAAASVDALERKHANGEFVRTDDKRKNVSSYYFFSSDGKKNKNKWDSFDPDAEDEEKNEGKGKRGDVLESDENRLMSLRKSLVVLKSEIEEKGKDVDIIAAEMCNSASEMGEMTKLKKKRRDLVVGIEKIESSCERTYRRVETLSKVLREETKARAACDEKNNILDKDMSSTSSSSSHSAAAKPNRKPLTKEEVEQLRASEKENGRRTNSAASKWNRDGTTWEERDISKMARDLLRKHLLEATSPRAEAGVDNRFERVEVTDVTGLAGDANIIVNQKGKRVYFLFSFTIRWRAIQCHSDSAENEDATDCERTETTEEVIGEGIFSYLDVSIVDAEDEETIEPSRREVRSGDSNRSLSLSKSLLQPEIDRRIRTFCSALKNAV